MIALNLARRQEDLPTDATLEDRLDVEVNQACFAYWAFSKLRYDPDNQGFPREGYIEAYDNVLHRLVFASDARAQAESTEYSNRATAWTKFAQAGFRRLGQKLLAARHLGHAELFAGDYPDIQTDVYGEMVENRVDAKGNPPKATAGRVYARKVADKEIDLLVPDSKYPVGVLDLYCIISALKGRSVKQEDLIRDAHLN